LGPSVDSTLIGFPVTAEEFIEKGERVKADVLQVYTLTASQLTRMRDSGFRIVRAVGVDVMTGKLSSTIEELEGFVEVCDLLLFEPTHDGKVGGMGLSTDYATALSPYIRYCPRFSIAGGLTPDNVDEALKLGPYMVDVSSGVESDDGRKDPEKVRQFVKRCKE